MIGDISNQIAEKQKELLRQQDEYAIVRHKILELRKKIVDLRAEMAPLDIACQEAESNIRRTRLEIKMLENEFWKNKNGL